MTMQQRVRNFHDDLHTQTEGFGGYLRCETCRATGDVKPHYWQTGWPKCCGYTMRWWTQRQIDAGDVEAHPPWDGKA